MALKDVDIEAEQELHSWCMGLYDDGVNQRKPWEGQWWENIATFLGDFWTEWNVSARRLKDTPIPADMEHRVRLPINLAQPIVRTEKAKIVKNRPILDILPNSEEKSDINASKVSDKVLNNHVEREFHMPRVRRRMIDWVLICGIGGIFVDYDPRALGKRKVWVDPKGNPLADPQKIETFRQYYRKQKKAPRSREMPIGELVIRPFGPWNLMWDFSELYFEDAMWAIYTEVMDCDKAWVRWGDLEDEETRPNQERVSPGPIEQRLLSRMDLSGKERIRPSTQQDMCVIHRMFIRPGHPYFPEGAHIVFTKEKILHSERFPFKHSKLPFALMGHISVPVSQYAMSVLQQVKGPVLEISKTVSQLIENRNVMANPPWLEAEQHNIQMDIVNKPGLRVKYTHTPNVPEPHPVEMPEMPSYVREMIPMMKEHVDLISGQGETTQGRVPPGARSGVAIAYLQEEDDTRLGPTIQEFEECLEETGYLVLETIAEKYSAPRLVRVYKKHGESEAFDFYGAMLGGNTTVVAQAGSALPRSKAAKQQFIMDLWDRQIEQDPRRVRDMLELGAGSPEEFEIDLNEASRENEELQRGQPVEAYEWQNHLAHHYEHRVFMKSADFKELNPDIQQMFLDHDTEHSDFLRDAQVQQMENQMLAMGQQGGGSQNGGNPNQMMVGENGQTGQAAPQFQSQVTPRNMVNDQPQ